ncbi:MAG: type II secretion system protein GspM [Acetobacteraceae bacterium]
MNAQWTALARRAAAVLILLLLVLVAWLLVVRPLVAMVTDRQRDIAMLSDRLATLRLAISRIPLLEERDASLDTRLDEGGGVWTDISDAAVAAQMQDQLGQAIRRDGGIVRSASTMQGTDEGGLHAVRVRFSVEGTLETIERMLSAIQISKPALFVDSMNITAPTTVPRDKPPRLNFDLEVIGYIRTSR